MYQSGAQPGTTFSQPIRAITTMFLALVAIGAGLWLIHSQIYDILQTNLFLNGLICLVFVLGIASCFGQVFSLVRSVSWIEHYVRQSGKAVEGQDQAAAPRLLLPLAALLGARGHRNLTISSSSGRTILDSVAQRLDEARDITRYLANLLVFLGLLGTFWGLSTTVPAVVETIRSLAPAEGEAGISVFAKLMSGLEGQLGGMGTAFASSLLGLGGSLIVGLLELFAGHGQNRFYRELEEWLSSITRIGLAEGDGGGQDQSIMVQVLDQMVEQMVQLQALYQKSEAARDRLEGQIGTLAQGLAGLADQMTLNREGDVSQTNALTRVAEGQERLVAALAQAEDTANEAENRMRLRSIDVQLLRILEELTAGRQESTADLRADLAALTASVRQMSRIPPAGRG